MGSRAIRQSIEEKRAQIARFESSIVDWSGQKQNGEEGAKAARKGLVAAIRDAVLRPGNAAEKAVAEADAKAKAAIEEEQRSALLDQKIQIAQQEIRALAAEIGDLETEAAKLDKQFMAGALEKRLTTLERGYRDYLIAAALLCGVRDGQPGKLLDSAAGLMTVHRALMNWESTGDDVNARGLAFNAQIAALHEQLLEESAGSK